MMPNNKPWSTKFGIRLDADSFAPSFAGFIGLAGLHLGACGLIWWLNWSWWLCISANIFILGLMIYTLERYIFSVTRYQLSFFFADNKGWVIQEDQNICYRSVLRYAFCGKYVVILVFQKSLILPIFFDSLPPREFRQLRKVLILLDYV